MFGFPAPGGIDPGWALDNDPDPIPGVAAAVAAEAEAQQAEAGGGGQPDEDGEAEEEGPHPRSLAAKQGLSTADPTGRTAAAYVNTKRAAFRAAFKSTLAVPSQHSWAGLGSLPDGMTHLGRQKAKSWMKENGIKMKAIDSRLSRTQSYSLAGMSTAQLATRGEASLS